MNIILNILIFSASVLAVYGVVCPSASKLPVGGCYNSGTYICQCATGVQMVCSLDKITLGLTSTWRKASATNVVTLCKNGTPPPKYTPIATFEGTTTDPYNNVNLRHAVVFLSCGASNSLVVMDQYTGKNWGQSTIPDRGTTKTSYNSNLYYVITSSSSG